MSKKTTQIDTIEKKLQTVCDEHRDMKLKEHLHNIEKDKYKVLGDLCRELDIVSISTSEHAVLVHEAGKTPQKIKKQVAIEITELTTTLQTQMDHLIEVNAWKHAAEVIKLEERIRYLETRLTDSGEEVEEVEEVEA